jgi:hypothetical protein
VHFKDVKDSNLRAQKGLIRVYYATVNPEGQDFIIELIAISGLFTLFLDSKARLIGTAVLGT